MEWTKVKPFPKGFIIYHSSVFFCIWKIFCLHRKVYFEKWSRRHLAIKLVWVRALKILSNTHKKCTWERRVHIIWISLVSRYQVKFANNLHVLYRKFTAQRFSQIFRYCYMVFILPLRLKKTPPYSGNLLLQYVDFVPFKKKLFSGERGKMKDNPYFISVLWENNHTTKYVHNIMSLIK